MNKLQWACASIGDIGEKILIIIVFILILAFCIAISYFGFAAIFYLICKCFDWTFTWKLSTGLWLVCMLISGVFKSKVTVNKN